MKRKLTIIFVLITLCMAGIIYAQVMGMYKIYQFTLEHLTRDISKALAATLRNREHAYCDSMKIVLTKKLETEKYVHSVMIQGARADFFFDKKNPDGSADTTFFQDDPEFSASVGKIYLHIHGTTKADTAIMNKVMRLLYDDPVLYPHGWQSVPALKNHEHRELTWEEKNLDQKVLTKEQFAKDSVLLTHLFKKELNKLGIDPPFYIWIANIWATDAYLKEHALSGSPFKTDEFSGGYVCLHHLIHYGFGNDQLHIGAAVFNPMQTTLSQMIQPLLISSFLIVFAIFCFFYLVRMILRQKRLAEMKDDFINNMTHELKTPIATIALAIEGMQHFDALEDKQKTERYLETSRKELEKLNNLVSKVLNMAGYEKGKIKPVIQELDVNELVNEIITTEQLNTSKTINFVFNNTGPVRSINADPVHFRNALANLVDNAKKYSGKTVDITISCYCDNEFIYFSIKDNGLGIAASQLKYIFDKFHRVPTGKVHNVKGTGLGLSYVKYVAEMHGGIISVKSEPGKGSEFTISLPVL